MSKGATMGEQNAEQLTEAGGTRVPVSMWLGRIFGTLAAVALATIGKALRTAARAGDMPIIAAEFGTLLYVLALGLLFVLWFRWKPRKGLER